MLLPARYARQSVALVCALLLGASAMGARADHVDPAPLADEVVQKLVRDRLAQSDPLSQALSQRLNEAAALMGEIRQQDARPDSEASERDNELVTKRTLIASKIAELQALRSEAHARLTTTRAKFEALGLTDKVNEWDALTAKVDRRFDRIEKALDGVRSAPDTARRALAVSHAKAELRVLHEDVKVQGETPSPVPIQTWRQDAPRPSHDEPASTHVPQYLSYRHAPGNNVYAFTGNTLLAALPPATPASAASCGSASDLAAALAVTQDAPLTPEIQALAANLGYAPAKLLQYVSRNIKFEPYYGSLKGAQGTLVAGSGGATDQASLLIALLRASNIPARYVKGQIQVNDAAPAADGGRAGHWLGAKSYSGAAGILGQGLTPSFGTVNNASSQVIGVTLTHVWVEACVPYSHYRGSQGDSAGSRWIPLDPSFKDAAYQAGIATNVSFNYADYLSKRGNILPDEYYATQVESAIKGVAPNYANNTLADVPYTGTPLPLVIDILPASLPYEVTSFLNWAGTASPEIADLPDSHRYKFNISVANGSAAPLLTAPLTLSLPQTALSRVTLSFQGATPDDQTALSAWQNDANLASAMPCTVNVTPLLKLDGALQASGSSAVGLCTANNQLTLSVTLAEVSTAQYPNVNSVLYQNIGAANNHALQAYAFQASDRLLAERAARLLASVKANPNPDANLDETEGEFLHVVGLKYMRYISDSARRIGQLDGGSGDSGTHLGLTSSAMKVQYLFDLPFAVSRSGFLVDVPGGRSRNVDLTTGKPVWKTFLLAGYSSSAFESYIWQEGARMDAVSTVRGMQFANESGIPVLTLNAANWAAQSPLLTSNANAALNYPAATVSTLQSTVNAGYTLNIPRSLIQYGNWTGTVWEQEKNDTVANTMSAGFIIGGAYAGGYTVFPSIAVNSYNGATGSGSIADLTTPTGLLNTITYLGSLFNSTTGANGDSALIVHSGDPVNMATGNLYHTERDLAIRGRGGLPIVFERAYNSRNPQPGPLGYGWTHSFNHSLKFYGVDTDGNVKVSWIDGTGGEKFFSATPVSGGIAPGTVLTNAPGVFVTFQRLANGSYTIREKNGLTYSFEANAGATAGQSAKLLSIADRNGNALTLAYTGANLTTVTDGLGRALIFTYDGANHIIQIADWSGRLYQYAYTDANNNLTSFKNPQAVTSSSQPPVTYQYYSAADGASLNHAMKAYTLPRGNGMNFEYYANGKVFRHTDPQGHSNTFTYNDFRREAVQVNERGQTRRFFFDPYGNPSQIVEETGATHTYTYDTATPANVHNRISKRDPAGYVTQYAYDANGNVTRITHPSNSTVALANFTAYNQPGKLKDANGNYSLLKYDAKGNLTQSLQLKAAYCAANNCTTLDPTAYTPAAGDLIAWRVNGYDIYGNLTSSKRVRDFAGQVASPTALSNTGPIQSTSYDASGLNPTAVSRTGIKNSDAAATTQSAALMFDSLGRLKTGIDADWYPTSLSYDAVDRVTQASDALGKLRTYQYDANGNPAGSRLGADDSSAASYDSNDRKATDVDAGGFVTAYQHDAAGNLTQLTNPDNYTLGFEYDAGNHLVKAYDQEGHAVSRSLDLEGKPRTVTDPNGNTVNYLYYDSTGDGRLKTLTDAANHSTTYTYDANGNPTAVTVTGSDASTTRTTLSFFDERNRPTRIVGPLVNGVYPVTCNQYDTLGRLTQVWAGTTTDTTSATCNYADATLKRQVTTAYDDFGRTTQATDALNQSWRYTYDANNNLAQAIDAKAQTTTYSWGTGHQLLALKDSSNATYSYTRNVLGQVTLVQSPSVTARYGYDASHRLITLTDSRGNKTLNYGYSPGGLLNFMQDSDANRTDYLYDPVGRLVGIWAPNYDYVSFNYDAGGRLLEKWFPNGVDARYTWNPDNTLASLTNQAGATTLSSHVYSYDALGNRQTLAETVAGVTSNYTYTYDALNRLTQVANGNAAQQENYGYDALGNRLTRQVNATTPVITAYVYDAANQLKEIHQTNAAGPLLASLGYDANGSLTSRSDTGLALVYDALNRLTQATLGAQVSRYAYDDQGRRIQKTVAGTATNFLYSGPDIIGEYGAAWGLPTAQYTHGPNTDDPIIRATASAAQYFHQDGLGSVMGVTNNLGGTDATQRFDAWGNKTASTGTSPRYGYTGREPDETGLIYYRARYYDSTIGRFVSRDPIGLQGGINQYAYVNGNPVNYTDPLGLIAANPQSIMLADAGKNYFSNTMTDIGNGLTSAAQSLAKVVPGAEAMNNATANFNAGKYGTAALWGVGALADAALAVGTGGESTAAKSALTGVANAAVRAGELRSTIPLAQQGRITMGVGLAEDANGVQRVLIGTSEPRGYLRPGVTLNPGETLVPGLGHAEADIVNFAQQNGLRLLDVGATRPICPSCAALIGGAGAKTVTPLKVP